MNPASKLFLVGPMGAGKSTIGRRLAKLYGLPFIDLDTLIEQRTGASIPLIFEHEGEAGFRRREAELLAECAEAPDPLVLATGGGAVLAPANRALLRTRGFVVHLAIGVDHQLARLARDTRRPLLATPDRRQRLEALAAERTPLYREIADFTFEAGPLNPGAAARRIVSLLDHHWQRAPIPETTP
jgi:shikimate kinase